MDFNALNLRVVTQPLALPEPNKSKPIIVGVSCFGMGGSNTHLVVSEYHSPSHFCNYFNFNFNFIRYVRDELNASQQKQKYYPILLSGHTPRSLNSLVNNMKSFLADNPNAYNHDFLEKLSYTLSLHRTHMSYRANFVVDSISSLISNLDQFIQRNDKPIATGM